MEQILVVLAGLMGAAGIALAAAGTHGHPGSGLDSAGYILAIHAAAIVAGMAALRAGLIGRPAGVIVLVGFVAGASLFSGDVAARVLLGHRLFPMAAPTGGILLILSWLALSVAALLAWR